MGEQVEVATIEDQQPTPEKNIFICGKKIMKCDCIGSNRYLVLKPC